MTGTIALGQLDAVAREAHSYQRYAPNLFNFQSTHDDLRSFILRILSEAEVHCPAEGAWLVKDCFLINGKHVVLRTGEILEQTVVDQRVEDFSHRLATLPETTTVELRQLAGNDDPIVGIMKAGAANYGHMLIEMMPRLLNARKIGLTRFNVALPTEALWARPMMDYVSEALGLTLKYLVCEESVHVDELVVMSPTSKHNRRKSGTTLELIDALLAHSGNTSARPSNRIAVWRKGSEKRAIGGDQALLSAFRAAGYHIVYPGDLSFPDQISTFSRASHIVAPLGAGLTNMAFASNACSTFMLDPGLYDFFYWDLACLKKQQFNWYFNDPIDFFDVKLLESGFQVDAQMVQGCLRRAEFL